MRPVRLVLADDHLVLRQALRALLEARGIEVVAEAADGRGAIEAVTKHSPDVVVLDVIMPGLNGVDAAREIARDRKSTRLNSSHSQISYAVFCLKKKKKKKKKTIHA